MATVELDREPGLAALYGRAVLWIPRRGGGALPDTVLVRRQVEVDRDRLAGYSRVCGFRLADTLPPTYPHLLGFPMALRLLTSPGFPYPAVGMVHVANRIEQYRPLAADQPLDLSVRLADLRPHPRGRQFDVVTVAEVAGSPVWREVSTYLRRERRAGTQRPADGSPGSGEHPAADTREGGRAAPDPAAPGSAGPDPAAPGTVGPDQPGPDQVAQAPSAVWRVDPGVGRAYAAVSGDRNPIHLSTLAARAAGFRRRIAHGMWSKARCLAQLAPRLPDGYTVEVSFRAPVLLPSTVGFSARQGSSGARFWLHDLGSGRTHLSGVVLPPDPG